ncbi:hypothetical protein OIU76_019974 [Salix suchowensis]|nr:hypothetical protein OIU76_019974 [Salix suchowensis]
MLPLCQFLKPQLSLSLYPEMATSASRSLLHTTRRLFCSNATPKNNHQNTHKFLEPNSFIGSWETPKTPKEAEAKLARLRREYAKQVKVLRKEYIVEVEALRIEKQRKEEARKEAIRVANEERKKLKAEAAKVRAEERKIEQEEFRKLLVIFLFFVFYYWFFSKI